MIIINLVYKVDLEHVNSYVNQHRSWLDSYYQRGIFLCSGPKSPQTGGIIIALSDDISRVQELMKEDPFYIHGIAEYSYTQFCPAKYHRIIESLIKP